MHDANKTSSIRNFSAKQSHRKSVIKCQVIPEKVQFSLAVHFWPHPV